MREQNLVDLQERLLIVDEQLEEMVLILVREVLDLDSVLGELCQLEQTLFELASLLSVLLDLLILLLVHDLIFESALHNSLPDLLDALDEEALKFVLLAHFVHFLEARLLGLNALPVDGQSQVPDRLVVVGFEQLNVFYNFFFLFFEAHF